MQANYANALCHRNATPLSVAVLAPCVWGENLACGGAWQVWWNGRCLRAKQSVATLQIQHGENGVFGRDLSLSLSLSRCSHFLHAFGLNLKGFFTHFIIVSSRFIANFSYFIVVATHLFAYERHFLGHCAFLKFLNALFLGFCALFVILSLCKRRKIHAFKAQLFAALIFYGYFATLSMTKQVSMTRTLSFWA